MLRLLTLALLLSAGLAVKTKTFLPQSKEAVPKAGTNKAKNEGQCFDASTWFQTFPHTPEAAYSKYSQGNQDGVLKSLFTTIGTTNKGFVEFGYPDHDIHTSYGNGHNLYEEMGFHPELLMDGANENPSINLHKHYVTEDNIVPLFKKYGVSKEIDYISVDIDSCDLWLFLGITKEYKPRVISVEYNSNYPIESSHTLLCPSAYTWKGDGIFGASVSALYLAGQHRGYTMVYATARNDVFFIRNDLVCPGTQQPLHAFAYAANLQSVPPMAAYNGHSGLQESLEVDFDAWLKQHPNH